jgi:hypothetical protein
MNSSTQKRFAGRTGSGGFRASGEFESTLRLIASLPAPEGLAERVQAGLRTAPAAASGAATGRTRILAWPAALRLENGWLQSSLARSAAAAAIAAVVAGGGWGVYSRVQLTQPQRGIALPRVAAPGGFQGAGAMRTPQTLNGPVAARTVTVGTQATKAAGKPTQTPVHRGKSAAARKAVAQPAAPAAK